MVFAWMLNVGVVCLVAWAASSVLRQRRRKRAQEHSEKIVTSPLAGLAVGAMMLDFQAIYQPQVRNAIVEMQEQKILEDGNGEEPPGGREFHQQLRQIRGGKEVEELTVRWHSPGG